MAGAISLYPPETSAYGWKNRLTGWKKEAGIFPAHHLKISISIAVDFFKLFILKNFVNVQNFDKV